MNPTTSSIQELNRPTEIAITIPHQNSRAEDVIIQIRNIESCPVCLDEYPSDQMIILPICKHSFCSECLKEYLETRVQNSQVLKISCPQSECKEVLEDSTIKMILNDKQYIKYRDISLKKMMNRDLEHKFCPKPGCTKSIKLLLDSSEYTTCSCGTQVCNVCSNFWHEGKTCLEAIDADFELFSKENDIRFCMVCKTTVKREEGCLHITCPVCDYQWCWVCGREFASHECPGHWSPMPPGSFKSGPKGLLYKYSLKFRIFVLITGILLSPVILAVLLLIWPLFVCFNHKENLSFNDLAKSIWMILVSIFIAVLFLPLTLLYVAFCLAAVIPIILISLLGRFLCCLCSRIRPDPALNGAQQVQGQRWRTGDVNKFVYTNKAQVSLNPVAPEQVNIEPLEQVNVTQIQSITIEKDEVYNEDLEPLPLYLPVDNVSVKIYEALIAFEKIHKDARKSQKISDLDFESGLSRQEAKERGITIDFRRIEVDDGEANFLNRIRSNDMI